MGYVKRPAFEEDDATFAADAYRVAGWGTGVAFYVLGWETEPGGTILHFDDACTDCVLYLANGDEPDAWGDDDDD